MKTQPKTRQAASHRDAVGSLTSRNGGRNTSAEVRPTTEFGKTLQTLLGKISVKDGVNEEEFFAGAVYQLIKDNFGAEIAKDFKSTFKLNMADKPAKERVASAERATKESLKFFVNSTILSKEDADGIREAAFQAAQLDNNKKALWDSIGKTKAVSSFSKVQTLGQTRLSESGYSPVTDVTSRNTRAKSTEAKNGPSRKATPAIKRVG